MKTTVRHSQTPNMKGKKFHLFGCKCCWARNLKDDYKKKIDLKEAAIEIVDPTDKELTYHTDEEYMYVEGWLRARWKRP